MASSAEIMQPLPDTLPEDFSEWDSGYLAAAQSANFNASAVAVGDNPATMSPSRSETPQYAAVAVLDESVPRFTAGSFDEADEFLLRSFRLKEAREEISPKPLRKTRTIAAAVAGALVSVLLLLAFIPGISTGLRFRLTRAKQSIAHLSTSANKDLAGNTPTPSSSALTGDAQSSTATPNPLLSAKSAVGADPATHKLGQVTPPHVESKMMTDQLMAPAQISHQVETGAPDEAPPASGFGTAAGEGLDGNSANLVRSVLRVGNNGPTVSPEVVKAIPPVKVTISSGVAAGMFLHGAKPQYPTIAKTVHMSGTVVLRATISKAGTIQNLRVASGPEMLRQAAVDAVSTWQYRPYLLNEQPVDIDTTISVVFSEPGL
jgi:protein TonB